MKYGDWHDDARNILAEDGVDFGHWAEAEEHAV